MEFFDLPDDIIASFLSNWIKIKELAHLFVALSDNNRRINLFEIIDSKKFKAPNNIVVPYPQITIDCLSWMSHYNIKVNHLVLMKHFFQGGKFIFPKLNFSLTENVTIGSGCPADEHEPPHSFWKKFYRRCKRLKQIPISINAVNYIGYLSQQVREKLTKLQLPKQYYLPRGHINCKTADMVRELCSNIDYIDFGHFSCKINAAFTITKNNPKLRTICWSYLIDDNESTKFISHVICNCPNLTSLTICGNYPSQQFDSDIIKQLTKLKTLSVCLSTAPHIKFGCEMETSWCGWISVSYGKTSVTELRKYVSYVKNICSNCQRVIFELDTISHYLLKMLFEANPVVELHIWDRSESREIMREKLLECQKFTKRIWIVEDTKIFECLGCGYLESIEQLTIKSNNLIDTALVVSILVNNPQIVQFDAVNCKFVNCSEVHQIMTNVFKRKLKMNSFATVDNV